MMKTLPRIYTAILIALVGCYLSAQAQTAATTNAAPTHPTKVHALDPTPELLQKSEKLLRDNMRKAYTGDELDAFLRTHPDSEHVPTILMRQGRSAQFDINALNHVLKLLETTPPSAELSKRMGISDHVQLKAELQSYVVKHTAQLSLVQARHRAATGKDIDLGAAATGATGSKFDGDVPSPMFTAPLSPLPYRKGYSWTLRMEDVLAKKTTEYTRTVTQLLPYGYIELNDGASVLDMEGNIRGTLAPARAEGKALARKSSFNANYRQHPQSLLRGREHTFGYVITDTMGDGKVYTQQGKNASMTTVASETIELPAGKFDTWRVERRSNWAVTETGVSGTFQMTAWFSPTLRRYVKREELSHNAAGVVVRHERHTLLRTD